MDTILPCSDDPAFQGESVWGPLDAGCMQVDDPDYYFDSYGHFGIHEEMIKDSVRTDAYRHAITRNPHLFRDKVVLDIGCGTGILSYFALRAGARHVYGIDCANIVTYAQDIVRLNGFSDKVTFIKGKVEEVTLPVEHVDIIISEWMGYFLLYESMLDTVLYARDKWLAPDGLMFPDRARMFVAAIEDAKYKYDKIEFWADVYGVDMSVMRKVALLEPLVDNVDSQSIVSSICPIMEINLQTMTLADIPFVSSYRLQIHKKDFVHALVSWFEVGFLHCHRPVTLSTSPKFKQTHWKQTIFYLDNAQPVNPGEVLEGSIAMRPNQINHRELDVKISYRLQGEHPLKSCQFYRIR